ncbi:metal-dependent hydrolase [Pseudomonas subflava]|uniref:metal-dependent hydrolase n=1 Tax=Pseudomonas subflava TaxID=2952933 RepID=UPI00207971B9|nr:metal-dependent hydrolase [Pseudomonas subflava]
MDSLTQAVLGASIQGALLGRWQGRRALLYGAMLGTLPDLDVVIDYGDAVADMTYHRGFSHSLLVLSLLAVAITLLARWLRPDPGYSGRRLFFAVWLVLITHPLLDAFTSYGTQLFWPLQTPPIAWSSIFIIDPLYTVPLLVAVVVGLVRGLRDRPQWLAISALCLSSVYLASTLAGKWMAEQRVQDVLAERGIQSDVLFSTPTPFNSLLWRVTVVDGADYHEALVSWFDERPPRLERIPRGTELAERLRDSPQHQRLEWFTHGVLRYDQVGDQLIVTDLRLGMTGYHPFRFVMAERSDGQWQPLPWVDRLPFSRGGAEQLQVLWRRIWDERQPIALLAWSRALQEKP